METIISLAPIQGITDYVFRNAFAKHFGGIDKYYAPYIRTDKAKPNQGKVRDIFPENNDNIALVPQLMTNNAEELVTWSNYLADLGYSEVNWNLGCPYPMVTKRKLGAGLLPYPELVLSILEESLPKIKPKLSIKIRGGLKSLCDLPDLLVLLSAYPLSEIIVHPRFAKQLYKGQADRDFFGQMLCLSEHTLAYNGDIRSPQDIRELKDSFPQVKHWMIARAIIANPFIATEFKGNELSQKEKIETFKDFYFDIEEQYSRNLSGDQQIINKMLGFWEYFAFSFSDSRKQIKRIKKARSLNKYNAAVTENFKEEWIA